MLDERLLEEGVSQTDNLSDVINMKKDTDSYALCPCGSQKKFKFCHQSMVEKIRREIGLGTNRATESNSISCHLSGRASFRTRSPVSTSSVINMESHAGEN